MTEYRYEKPDRIILFGGGSVMVEFRGWLKQRGYVVDCYTAPRQLTQDSPEWMVPLDNPGRHVPLNASISARTLGICFGPAWPIPESLRGLFGHRLLDFMSIPFPAYQGGAHETWATLNDQREWGCCMQLVTENTVQGERHDGDVIAYERFPFDQREGRFRAFLRTFIDMVEAGAAFSALIPDAASLFFPRLNTTHQGWIDWSWTRSEIWRAINAFAAYGGVSTHCGYDVVRIPTAGQWTGASLHPFCAGLILADKGNGDWLVAMRDGILLCRIVGGSPKVGDRLHTPGHVLEAARLYVPSYDAKGDSATSRPEVPSTLGTSTARVPETRVVNYVAVDPLRIQLLRPDDVTDAYVGWLNDPEVNRYLEVRHQHWHQDDVVDYVKRCQSAYNETALFGIYLHERHIGNIKVGPVNDHHLHADLSYFIGEKSLWGKGYATKAVKLAVGWAFEHMNLHRLQAGTYAANVPSAKVLLRAGFTLEATLRQQLLLDGKWTDHHLFALTNPAWTP